MRVQTEGWTRAVKAGILPAAVRPTIIGLLWAAAAWAWMPTVAVAQDGSEAQTAVRLARAAFEYRDFNKVVETLDPWLHPPQIVDPALEVQARELLGVSLHVLKRVKEAEEEFAQLLKLDPVHELDPFVVPPPVIQTFEEVRAKMKPALDAILGKKIDPRPPDPVTATRVELVEIPHPIVTLAPFGIPQFVLDEPAWGAMWAAIQGIGLVVNFLGFFRADAFNPDSSAYRAWVGVQFGGLATFLAGWGGSSIHGYAQLSSRRLQLMTPVPATGPITPRAGVSWRWSF